MPENSSQAALDALLNRAAFVPLSNQTWLRVTGEDRVRWLNGMATNSIQALATGQGCYTFFLNAQGRIQADATVFLLEECLLLETANAGSLATMLDHFVIMDDVELTVEQTRAGLLLAGPQAFEQIAGLGLTTTLDQLELEQFHFQGQVADLLHAHSPLVPRFELWSDPATIGLIIETLRHLGVAEATQDAVEMLRLLEGTPSFGIDMRDKDLAQETNQLRALHFSKGCYLGQEIVERIRSRGQVHRTLQGFELTGELPAVGATLALETDPGKSVGEITSAAEIILSGVAVKLALGYIRREALSTKTTIIYPGGVATPIALPRIP